MATRWVVVVCAVAAMACGAKLADAPDSGSSPPPIQVKAQATDKVDLLFAIDNSASMGDKQDLLGLAVPVLIGRLLNPNCVATDASKTCSVASDCSSLGAGADCDSSGNGGSGECFVPGDNKGGALQCTSIAGTRPEFKPVHDMHVGIVSSSLGGGGSPDVCVAIDNNDSNHVNDKGHLVNRTVANNADGPAIANAKPTDGNGGNFLAWLPASDPKNAGKSPPNVTPYGDGQQAQLTSDFTELVRGVQQHGCGLEAQLESWYHFLVQPDPYDSIDLSSDNPPRAQLDGVDVTLLKMRHDFLRPDSLVAIIQLTDEEDSWSDPLWLGGYGWAARSNAFPGGPNGAGPRGTSECDQPEDLNSPTTWGPNNPDCTSCAFPGSNKPVSGTAIGSDPNCNSCAGGQTTCPTKGWYTPASSSVPIAAADGLNVRYGSQYMRTRYGFDNQHDVQRYIDGLTLPTAPDRNSESHQPNPYSTTVRNCTNPLFAADLPDGSDTSPGAICNLPPGSRTPDLVFYALIGGVPHGLVEDANGKTKLDLSADDWTKIVGKDPAHYIFDGIDPHMIESPAPRQGLQAPGTTYSLGTDPDNGREYDTRTSPASIDLEYACTFDLPTPKDCNAAANGNACDCTGTASSSAAGPPLCSTTVRTTQIKGKAYPTIRELRVAKGLGTQSVVASLCARDVTSAATAATFGYNPAMQGIINRLKGSLNGQCLPPLPVNANGTAACTMLVVYPGQTDQASGCTDVGMSQPTPLQLVDFQTQWKASGVIGSPPVVCIFKQLTQGTDYSTTTCEGGPAIGWCYVQHVDGCAQSVKFGGSGPPAGTAVSLQCSQ